jgi:hypothetical protein
MPRKDFSFCFFCLFDAMFVLYVFYMLRLPSF